MGIIVTVKCEEGNVFLQLSGKTNAAVWLPSVLVKKEILPKMLLADMNGSVSVVIPGSELPVLIDAMPENAVPEMQKVGLVEINGYGLQTDVRTMAALFAVFEQAEISVAAVSVSDTDLTVVVPENRGKDCLEILQNHFGDRIE